MNQVGKHCITLCKQLDTTFTLKGNEIAYEEAFSERGLLPAICKRADQLSSLCLGYGIGITLTEDKKSTVGSVVSFDDLTPEPIRMLCIMDVILELIRAGVGGPVSLDELLYD